SRPEFPFRLPVSDYTPSRSRFDPPERCFVRENCIHLGRPILTIKGAVSECSARVSARVWLLSFSFHRSRNPLMLSLLILVSFFCQAVRCGWSIPYRTGACAPVQINAQANAGGAHLMSLIIIVKLRTESS